MHVCTRVRRGLTGIRARGRGAHKTRQTTAKHLALLASLGMLGLSEHMVQVDLGCGREGTHVIDVRKL